jgi:hypothetical protein
MTHVLNDTWVLWAHLPHDTDWSVKSYKKILTFNTVEEAVALYETIPLSMVQKCMLFLMRKGIKPMWEDPKNKNGGCFSYKIKNNHIGAAWTKVSYLLLGESLAESPKSKINGITISPKKNFSVLKIWLETCAEQNPKIVNEISGLSSGGCIFKRHVS